MSKAGSAMPTSFCHAERVEASQPPLAENTNYKQQISNNIEITNTNVQNGKSRVPCSRNA